MKSIPLFFLIMAAGILLLAAAAGISRAASGSKDASLKIDVAVAGAEGDEMTEKGVMAVRNLDVVKSVTKFHLVDEVAADEGIDDGRYDAAIYLTGNMYEDINEGVNTPVVVRFSDNSVLEADLFRELIETGVRDLGIAESSIYAVYDLSEEYPTAKKTRKIATKMAKRYIGMFFARTMLFDSEMISDDGNVTPLAFAVVTAILVLLLLTGVGFGSFYGNDVEATGRALERAGVSRWYQDAVRIGVMGSVIWLMYLIVSIALTLLLKEEELSLIHPLAAIPVCIAIAALIHLIYQAAPAGNGALVYLLAGAFTVVAGGRFFAPSAMPKAAEVVARILPFSTWHRYLALLSAGGSGLGGLCLRVLAGAAVMIILSELCRFIKNRIAEKNAYAGEKAVAS